MARLVLRAWGDTHEIAFSISKYATNGNTAIQMWKWVKDGDEQEGYYEPWSSLTVNLTKECKPNCAFIDTNNNGDNIVEWLEANDLGFQTGNYEISGYCIYPEFEFDMDKLMKYTEVRA